MIVPRSVEGQVARCSARSRNRAEQLVAIRERVSRRSAVARVHLRRPTADARRPAAGGAGGGRGAGGPRERRVALRTVSGSCAACFEALSDAYLRERRTDLDDVKDLLLNLSGAGDAHSCPGCRQLRVVADDLCVGGGRAGLGARPRRRHRSGPPTHQPRSWPSLGIPRWRAGERVPRSAAGAGGGRWLARRSCESSRPRRARGVTGQQEREPPRGRGAAEHPRRGLRTRRTG